MSRLDYVTIAIVAVCVAALVYLIYMTTNLMGDSGDPGTTAETTAPATNGEDTGDDTYYFSDENRTEDGGEAAGPADAGASGTDNTSGSDYQNEESLDNGKTASSTPTVTPNEMDTKASGVTEDEYTARGGSTSGSNSAASDSAPYMVIGGTFKNRSNAEAVQRDLRGLGYNKVSLESFDRGEFTVVLVDRFNSYSEAQSLVKELTSKGKPAFVKRKQ